MKISTNWIKHYVDLENVDLTSLASDITNAGVNVETITSGLDISHLVVGEVLECDAHPNSDHLHVCKVNVGNETLQIVCGAPNVRTGLKVIVALIGAVLPGDFEIKKSTIRNVESSGMLCALSELGLKDEYSGGIYELNNDSVVGSNPIEYLNVNSDTIYDLDLNPNRNDCLSHLGFAYEVASVLKKKVQRPEIVHKEINDSIKDNYKLNVETDNCSLILLKLIKNVSIKESPKHIQDELISAGMRPINNVVDISNYIMLEYGQPLHFYDADKLGRILGVRMAQDQEKVLTLDGKERTLDGEDIVITNGDQAIGVAGVMGGYSTEVDENTKNIIVESAIFEPLHIRKTSIKLDLRSEASLRFEKGLNYEYTYEAIERACNLLENYASADCCKDILVHDTLNKKPKMASVTLEKINSVLGIKLTDSDVKESFDRLGFKYSNSYDVEIPNRRMDVSIKEDLIEEIGRMYGFHNINGSLPSQTIKQGSYQNRIEYRKDISKRLRSLCLNEVKTYSLLSEKELDIFNYENKELIKLDKPISKERTHIRTTLIPSLIEVMNYNIARGVDDINIYEISNIYYKEKNEYVENMKLSILMYGKLINNSWNNSNITDDFYTLKGIIENLIHYLGLDKRVTYTNDNIPSFMHPGMSANIMIDKEVMGFIGKLNPNINKKSIYICELNLEKLMTKKSGKLHFEEPNKYPSVKKDAAFIVDDCIKSNDIVKEILSVDKNLITECIPFDEYQMDNKKSLAFSIKFESNERTLTEVEVNNLFSNIIDIICKKYNAILRDK